MYEYKFVRVPLTWWKRQPKENYKDIIEEQAIRGWRLVQIFSPSTGIYGLSQFFELIFQKEKKRTF